MKANKMSEIFELSIREQLEGLKGSAFSSVDLVNSFLERIEKIDPKLNSFITVTAESALKQAKESDKRYKKHIKKELNKLYQEINNINAKLIIAPVTIPSHAKNKNFYHLRAVNMLNEVLKDFSKKNVIFFDTISILKKGSENNFIDNCCHLSIKGADVVSSHLSTILINLK